MQSCPGRERALETTLSSVGRSDLGCVDAVSVHPPGVSMRSHFLSTLDAIAKSGRRFGLRLEDDVTVGEYILWNLGTWPALDEPDFGAGWGFVPFSVATGPSHKHETARGNVCFPAPELVCSQCVLIRAADATAIATRCHALWNTVDGQQDRALSRAVWEMGRRVYLHLPPVCEHDLRHPSTLAQDRRSEPTLLSTFGLFEADWRR